MMSVTPSVSPAEEFLMAGSPATAELKQMAAQAKEEKIALQKQLVYLEFALTEAQAALGVAAVKSRDSELQLKQLAAARKKDADQHEEALRVLQSRMRSAPAVGEVAVSLFVELRSMMNFRVGAPPVAAEEVTAAQTAPTLVVLTNIRMWLRRLFAFLQQSSRREDLFNEGQLQLVSSPLSAKKDRDDSSLNTSQQPGLDRSRSRFANTMLLPPEQADAVAENEALKEQVKTLSEKVQVIQQDVFEAQQNARIATDLAKRETTTMRQELRNKDKLIAELQSKVSYSEGLAASHLDLARAKRDAAEAKKHMKTALQAKQQELDVVKRTYAAELKEASHHIEALQSRRVEVGKLQMSLAQAQNDLSSVKGQMARADIKGLINRKRQAETLAQNQRTEADRLKAELQSKESALAYIESANHKLAAEYLKIFDAHYKARLADQKRERAEEEKQSRVFMAGPNSELNAQHYRQRYTEVLEELKHTQGKLKQLILLSHYEHLVFNKEQSAIEEELSVTKDKLRWSELSLSRSQTQQVSMQQDSSCVVPFSEWKAERPEDYSTTLVSPSAVVGEGVAHFDRTIDAVGSKYAFGNPLADAGLIRISAVVEGADETSLRELGEVITTATAGESPSNKLALRKQSVTRMERVADLGPKRKDPVTHRKSFEFAQIGLSRQNVVPGRFSGTPFHQPPRPASAMSAVSRPSSSFADKKH